MHILTPILYPYRIGEHFVYTDHNQNVVLSKQYDFAYPFDGAYAIVVCNGRQGVINKKGKWILKPKYKGLKIVSVGPVQLFITYDNYDTNYEVNKWRILPNWSLFSHDGPLIATAVSYTKWCIFDETRKRLLKIVKQQMYDDYNNHGQYYSIGNHYYNTISYLSIIPISTKYSPIRLIKRKTASSSDL